MDYYKSMDKLKKLFTDFIEKVPSFGKSFICIDDKNNNEIIKKIKIKNFYTYGTNLKSQFLIKKIKQLKEYSKFDIEIKLPGKKKQPFTILKFHFLVCTISEMQQLPQLFLLL